MKQAESLSCARVLIGKNQTLVVKPDQIGWVEQILFLVKQKIVKTASALKWILFLFCSIIYDRLGKEGKGFWEATKEHLAKYGDAGLRTLAIAYRQLEESEYTDWNQVFVKAKTTIGANRDELLEQAAECIEQDLFLLGATAVEDKLQKGVSSFSKLLNWKLFQVNFSSVFFLKESILQVKEMEKFCAQK